MQMQTLRDERVARAGAGAAPLGPATRKVSSPVSDDRAILDKLKNEACTAQNRRRQCFLLRECAVASSPHAGTPCKSSSCEAVPSMSGTLWSKRVKKSRVSTSEPSPWSSARCGWTAARRSQWPVPVSQRSSVSAARGTEEEAPEEVRVCSLLLKDIHISCMHIYICMGQEAAETNYLPSRAAARAVFLLASWVALGSDSWLLSPAEEASRLLLWLSCCSSSPSTAIQQRAHLPGQAPRRNGSGSDGHRRRSC